MAGRTHRGFTLVEVLIVVIILGILASVVLPQFTEMTTEANDSTLIHDLQGIRSVLQTYRFEHSGQIPAQGTTNAAAFRAGLCKRTDPTGAVNETGGKCGPYLPTDLPRNPFNHLRTVKVTLTDVPADDTTGWSFNSVTGSFRANSTGTSQAGTPLIEF